MLPPPLSLRPTPVVVTPLVAAEPARIQAPSPPPSPPRSSRPSTTQAKSMADIYGVAFSDDEEDDGPGGDPVPSAPMVPPPRTPPSRYKRLRRGGPAKRPRVVVDSSGEDGRDSRPVAAAPPVEDDSDCIILSVKLTSARRRTVKERPPTVDVPTVSEDSPSASDAEEAETPVARRSGRLNAFAVASYAPTAASDGDSVGDEEAFEDVLGSGRAAQETARRKRLRLAPPTAEEAAAAAAAVKKTRASSSTKKRLRVRPLAAATATAPDPVRQLDFGGASSDSSTGSSSVQLGTGRRLASSAPMQLVFTALKPSCHNVSSDDEDDEEEGRPEQSPPSPLLSPLSKSRSVNQVGSAAVSEPGPSRRPVQTRLERLCAPSAGGTLPWSGRRRSSTAGVASTLTLDDSDADTPPRRAPSSPARQPAVETAAAGTSDPPPPSSSAGPRRSPEVFRRLFANPATGGSLSLTAPPCGTPLPAAQWTWRGCPMTRTQRQTVEYLTTGRVRDGSPPAGLKDIAVTVAVAKITLRRVDLRRLRGSRWLNDEVMNAYVAMLNERNKQRVAAAAAAAAASAVVEGVTTTRSKRGKHTASPSDFSARPLRVYCFNTFFYTRLTQGPDGFDYEGVRRWTLKAGVDVVDYDLLLVPVNASAIHWALGVIDMRVRRFAFLDSLHGPDRDGVTATLARWLGAEVASRHGWAHEAALCLHAWSAGCNAVASVPVPRQLDAGSCGVYVLAMAERLERGVALAFGQRDIPLLRKQMVLDLHDGRLM